MRARDLIREARSKGILPKKGLGQHFLTSEGVVKKILEGAEVGPEDVVLEIGPGLGTLTFPLAERAKRVIAVEVDKGLCEFLREKAKGLPLEVVEADFLNWDLSALRGYGKVKVVSNLPFFLSTEILFRLLENQGLFSDLTLMFQWEVARRITAQPGSKDYGALTVMVRLYSEPKLLFKVPKGAFFPPPEVDAGVVRFSLREPPKGGIETLRRTVEGLFSLRRKTLSNALRKMSPLSKEEIQGMLEELGIDPMKRPEAVSPEEFLKIARALEEKGCSPCRGRGD